jgi:hypothetical protein
MTRKGLEARQDGRVVCRQQSTYQPLGSVRGIHVSETKPKECATSYTTPLTSKRRHGLMQHQKFVKAFMSPGTGTTGCSCSTTGTGKTCTAVSVAEMYGL